MEICEAKAAVADKVEEIKSKNWKEIGKGVIMGLGAVAMCYGIYKLTKHVGTVEIVKDTIEPVVDTAAEVVEQVPEVLEAVA